MKRVNVYIDESGDLGYQRGSNWFCITAVIVEESDEKNLRSTIKKIKEKLNISYIHFVKIKGFGRRSFIVNKLNDESFTIISVVSDTRKLDIAKKSTTLAYNYLSRLLIERVSWYLRDNDMIGNVLFSSRNSKKDEELVGYVAKMVKNSNNTIASNHIGTVSYKKASEWDMLQLADVCASSIYQAHQPDDYGFRYPCFINKMINHLYTYDRKVLNYGMKYFPDDSNTNELKDIPVPCGKEKRLPDHVTHD